MTSDTYNRTRPPEQLSLRETRSDPAEGRVHLLTFGGGHVYRSAVKKLAEEAAKTGWFDVIHAFSDESSDPIVSDIYREHGGFILENGRGHGLWVWKSYLISRFIERLSSDDIVVYIDSGSELSHLGARVWREYICTAKRAGGLFFSLPFIEQDWTKSLCLREMSATAQEVVTPQIQATWFMLTGGEIGLRFARQWLHYCTTKQYSLLRDPTDRRAEAPCFVDHRHDQSILSLLVKRSEFAVLPWQDRYASWLYFKNSWVLLYPVHATRRPLKRRVYSLAARSNIGACRQSLSRLTVLQRLSMLFSRSKSHLRYMARFVTAFFSHAR